VVFLEDYDISLAQELVRGVDVWINTPRRPWEACGTSGMKVVVNGGLNLSTLDGWWEEAYRPDLGWAIGDHQPHANQAEQDRREAEELYGVLEREVVPAFYDRDPAGVPRAWVARMRRSMGGLTARFSASRMMRDYLDQAYLPAARALRERTADGAAAAKGMAGWARAMRRDWPNVHIGEAGFTPRNDGWDVSVPVYLGAIAPDSVRVEAYAQALPGSLPLGHVTDRGPADGVVTDRGATDRGTTDRGTTDRGTTDGGATDRGTTARGATDGGAEVIVLSHDGAIPGAIGGYLYLGRIPGTRAATDYTVRMVASYPGVRVPAELPLIRWQR
jgi:starch phosphorylase